MSGVTRIAGGVVVLAVLMAAFGVFAPSLPPAEAAPSRSELRERLDSNKRQLNEIRENIREAEQTKQTALEEIGTLDRKIDGLEDQLAQVTRERDAAQSKLDEMRAELARLEQAITAKRKTIDKASHDLAVQQERLDARTATMYKRGKVAYIEVLLNTERLTDLVTRFSLISKVIETDTDLLEQIDGLRDKVEAEKAELESQEARVVEMEMEQERTTGRLESLVSQRVSTLQELDSARSQKQAIVAKAESDQATWEKQEDALLNESASIETELRNRASAPSSSAGGSSGGSTQSVSATGGMMWPVQARVSSNFGYRVHPIFGTRKMHTGIDLAIGSGTPVKAADGGAVIYAGWRGGYGKTVMLDHGGGTVTLYAHMSSILVGNGQSVGKGTVIGRVGSTGYSTGPHLHWEVRRNGSPVNPRNFL